MIRRGTVYGSPLPQGVLEDDGAERGLMFAFVGANLGRQFEFVQSQWANGGNAFRLGQDQDVMLGPQDTQGTAKMTIPGESGPFFLGPLARVVTMRGGEYYFTPGINGLHHLAGK